MSTQILVVDNEQRLCNLIKQSLEMDNYVVQTAISGKDAIQLVDESNFDIVITDLRMTPVDGLAVLKHVKENKPGIEVILITKKVFYPI